MKTLVSFLCTVALGGSLAAAEFEALTVQGSDGQTLPVRLLHPARHEGKVPLVVVLHGAGERGSDNSAQLKYGAPLFEKANEKYPCYVLVPQCPNGEKWVNWDWSKDFTVQPKEMTWPTKLLIQELDQLPTQYSDIDPDRVYVTGLSMGGYGTWDLLTRFPDRFAAGIPICGGGDASKGASLVKIPIWAFHGDKDPAVPIAQTRNMIAAIEKAGGHPLYSEYPNVAHESWKNAYAEPELLPWLFAQKRGQAPVPFEKTASPFSQPPSNQFPGAGPVQEGIWFRPLWQSRRAEWAKAVPSDQGAIVFLGDSITQGWSSLAGDFAPRKVANRGISGDTTRGVLYRLKGDVIDVHPKAVCILIGTNDIGLGSDLHIAAENVTKIIEELHKADPKLSIILCKLMPSSSKKARPADKLQEYNTLLEKNVTPDGTVTLVDTWTLFANDQGEAKPEEFPDLLHPNAGGYAKWKAVLDPILTKIGL